MVLVLVFNLLKKDIDPETKQNKQEACKHDLPAWVGEFTEYPANVERNPRGIPSDSASMENAPRKGGLNRLVFHLVFGEELSPVPPPHKEGTLSGSN